MAMWWSFYLFSVAGAGWLNVTIAGTLTLTLLFQGSTRMTERISRDKYPAYGEYQRTTSRLIPWLPRG
jgi:steroid 5-alpha reductase family enzyme